MAHTANGARVLNVHNARRKRKVQLPETSNSITITVYGIAVPKGRPRVAVRGSYPVIYTPTKTKDWENLIKMAAQGKVKELITDPVFLIINFYLPRPKSLPKKVIHHVKRPDLDNLGKAVMDALNGVIWKDDSQVVYKYLHKCYDGERPRVEIAVKPLAKGVA